MGHQKISFIWIIILSSFMLSCQSQLIIKKMEGSYDKTFSRFLNDSMSSEEIGFANSWKSYIFKNRENLFDYFSITTINDKLFILIEEVDYSNGNYNSNLITNDKIYSFSKKDYDDSSEYGTSLFFNQKIIDKLKNEEVDELLNYSKNPNLVSSHNSFIFTVGSKKSIETYTMDAFDLDNNSN